MFYQALFKVIVFDTGLKYRLVSFDIYVAVFYFTLLKT